MNIVWDDVCKRVRTLRTDYLNNLSQTAFGKKLGVSRSVINNIERNALEQPENKKSLFLLICHEFNVSEDWLLYGRGDVFVSADQFNLDTFVRMNDGSDLDMSTCTALFYSAVNNTFIRFTAK